MQPPIEQAQAIQDAFVQIREELAKIIVGQHEVIQQLFICLLCGGHALIEGVPGLGKTLIVKSLSQILDLRYSRIQFTPDLMPADILGTNMVKEDERGSRYFEFFPGPIFGQLILADEINRASPKTQAALLEAMQEERVTVFGTEYPLQPPFMVLATQNPIEMEGTYPLPEAQIDRFFFKVNINYPAYDDLRGIIDKTTQEYQPDLQHILHGPAILEMRTLVKQVPIAEHVKSYAIRLVLSSHPEQSFATDTVKQYVQFGASPRGVQSLVLAGKVAALLDGRYNVSRADIRAVAKPALRHRLVLNIKGAAEGIAVDQIIDELVASIPEKITYPGKVYT
ncbi:AAA domain-containing protein [candidate division KSB3 bacterium]|uniref:AAA domain-containing protein n=1 Tax=candidate division KSB3 bacterium TaxID=2044937 RepID=A0A9D5JUR3_9BACT|nr:AAA domain-containing protein [candidate division KSB3 bacterium]MBD3324277.1 AAA domain-containing protein [candidate division KSB3 bacterium]